MDLRDFIVTPVVALVMYVIAYIIRPYVTDAVTRRYFMPALTVRIFGAVALGMVYQFYYNGGDTFNFHTHGSRHIWEAFMDSPEVGIKLMFADGTDERGIYKYSSMIPFFRDGSSYTVIRLSAFFDLFTFSAYSATALFFAAFSFTGSWMFFLTFYEKYPSQVRWLALASLFVPSVVFWGSGIMKDSLVCSCIGIAIYEINNLFIRRKFSIKHLLVLIGSLYLIFLTKKFVLQAFIPSAMLWVYLTNLRTVRSATLRIVIVPVMLVAILGGGYLAVSKVGEGDSRYAIDKLATTAKITAIDIGYQTGRDAGSGYSLGELDGTFSNMILLSPQAINVSLFRPYLWEVRNPLMLMSAVESMLMLLVTLYVVAHVGGRILGYLTNPDVAFTLTFSLIFAFAVGISTYNFGTLSRYKIPIIPMYAVACSLIIYLEKLNREKKFSAFDSTE